MQRVLVLDGASVEIVGSMRVGALPATANDRTPGGVRERLPPAPAEAGVTTTSRRKVKER